MKRFDSSIVDGLFLHQSTSLQNLTGVASGPIAEAAELVLQCAGIVVCVGVGKSGFVAAKAASSLRSIGIRSVFLNGSEALHGDLGILSREDLIVLVSKSGLTDEIRLFQKTAATLGCKTIALLTEDRGNLQSEVDLVIPVKIEAELDHLGILPTNSSLLSMACLDALVATVANEMGLEEKSFARNHPSGAIGEDTSLTVSDVMIHESRVGKALESDTILAAAKLLTEFPTGVLIVTQRHSQVEGIITDGDLRRALTQPDFSILSKIGQHMTKSPLVIGANDSLRLAREKLTSRNPTPVSVAPVMNDLKLVGVVSLQLLDKRG